MPTLQDPDLKAAIASSVGGEATRNYSSVMLVMVQGEEQHLPDRELSKQGMR